MRPFSRGLRASSADEPTFLRRAMPWLLLFSGLAVLGAIALSFAPNLDRTRSAVSPQRAAIADAPHSATARALEALGIRKASAVDPADLFSHVRARATAWRPDAVLVSIAAQPVRNGVVDLTSGGAVVYTFGSANGAMNPGSGVAAERFVVRVDASGPSQREVRAAGGRSTAEPNCTLAEASKSALASGLGDDRGLAVRYEMSARHGKAVWQLSALDDPKSGRTVDGWTCAILVR